MKSKTIWESASRPLFVRSVWLESPHEGRGVQHRHFILDYESEENIQQRRQALQSTVNPVRNWRRKDSLRHSASCDLSELSSSNESQLLADNSLQIGSAKIKLQQPLSQQTRQRFKLLKLYRRPSLTRPFCKHSATNYKCNLNWKLQEIYSRHSSLQDLHSNLSMACLNPEERLAERVLNWLDLAGKSGLLKSQEGALPIENIENEKTPENLERQRQRTQLQHQQHQQQQSQRQRTQQRPLLQGAILNKKKIKNSSSRYNSEHNLEQTRTMRQQRDRVKPITIIFNRDGYPVRLNRAARNIDICALASSTGTVRRLAGSLASARLHHGNEAISYKPRLAKPIPNVTSTKQQQHPARSSSTTRLRQGTETVNSTTQATQKRFHDNYGAIQEQDFKRQLHIFMPSLPKKGINSTSPSLLSAGCTGDDSSMSLLSKKLNESCKL